MISAYDEGRRKIDNALTNNSLPHAVLLKGDMYVSSRLVIFAASRMFGKSELQTDEIPDFLHLDGKAMRVADTEKLLEELNVIPAGGRRLVEIKQAGQMSVIVQNMLLKTIEEPPPGNYFFLYGDESGLLPTIRSRCAALNIGALSPEEIALYVQRAGAGESDALYYANLGGDAQTALRLYDDEDYRNWCLTCIEYICTLGKKSLFSSDAKLCAQGDARKCADLFDIALSDMRRVKMGMKQRVVTRSPHNAMITECAGRLTDRQISEIFKLTEQMHISLNSNSPVNQVFDTFAAGAEKVTGYGRIQ